MKNAKMWCCSKKNGRLKNSYGLVRKKRLGIGHYRLYWMEDVDHPVTVLRTYPWRWRQMQYVSEAGVATDVRIFNRQGEPVDKSFDLMRYGLKQGRN